MWERDRGKTRSSSTDTAQDHKAHNDGAISSTLPYQDGILGKKSPGVQRIEAISAHFTLLDRIFVFFGVFLIAYAYGLDGITRYTFQVKTAQKSEDAEDMSNVVL